MTVEVKSQSEKSKVSVLPDATAMREPEKSAAPYFTVTSVFTFTLTAETFCASSSAARVIAPAPSNVRDS